jgi:hypothetical protein
MEADRELLGRCCVGARPSGPAQPAEAATADVRTQLDSTRGQLDQLREPAAELRGQLAAAGAERDAARADVGPRAG